MKNQLAGTRFFATLKNFAERRATTNNIGEENEKGLHTAYRLEKQTGP